MNKMRFGSALTIFILFFGLSLLESVRSGNYFAVIFWIIVAVLFLYAEKGFGRRRLP
jgi:hypothetical protein